MDSAEAQRLRREIVDGIAPLLREELHAESWGRVIVEVVRTADGTAAVAGIEVEEILGDEERIDAVFNGASVRSVLPALAAATEALCAIDGVDLDDVRGGTFVRLEEGFAWLPGLVRAPSRRLDSEREELLARVQRKNAELSARFRPDRVDLDVARAAFRWWVEGRVVGEARATLVGTFALAQRAWAWAWGNPSADEAARKACQDLVDAIGERDLWELTTPAFTTDEPTAWVLAAFMCDRTRADGVQRIARADGSLLVLLHDVRAA